MNDIDRDNHQFNCEFATAGLLKHQRFHPLHVVYQHDRRQIPIADLWRLPREDAHTVLRAICIAHDIRAVAVMAEAWVVSGTPRDVDDMLAAGITPSKSERRIEVLSVVMVSRESALGTMWEIIRDDAGNISGLSEPMLGNVEMVASGLVEALGPGRPTRREREAAAVALKAGGIELKAISSLRAN